MSKNDHVYQIIDFYILKMSTLTIDNVPDEILEYIFYLLPPYEDIRCCMSVNKKWNQIASRKNYSTN